MEFGTDIFHVNSLCNLKILSLPCVQKWNRYSARLGWIGRMVYHSLTPNTHKRLLTFMNSSHRLVYDTRFSTYRQSFRLVCWRNPHRPNHLNFHWPWTWVSPHCSDFRRHYFKRKPKMIQVSETNNQFPSIIWSPGHATKTHPFKRIFLSSSKALRASSASEDTPTDWFVDRSDSLFIFIVLLVYYCQWIGRFVYCEFGCVYATGNDRVVLVSLRVVGYSTKGEYALLPFGNYCNSDQQIQR